MTRESTKSIFSFFIFTFAQVQVIRTRYTHGGNDWVASLPTQQSLGTCLKPLHPRSFSCSCNTTLNHNSAPALSPCLSGRFSCSCSCNKKVQGPQPQHPKGPRRFSVISSLLSLSPSLSLSLLSPSASLSLSLFSE